MTDLTYHRPLIEQYKNIIEGLRADWQRCLTPTGRKKFGPSYFAVTYCQYEDEIGLTSTKSGVGKRWACKTCFNFAAPIWSDTEKCPTIEEALIEYGKWASKETNAKKAWTKGMMGNDIR